MQNNTGRLVPNQNKMWYVVANKTEFSIGISNLKAMNAMLLKSRFKT